VRLPFFLPFHLLVVVMLQVVIGIGVLTGRVAAKRPVAAGIECPEGIARVGSVARACMASPEQEAFMLQLKTGDAL
jgi:hypothetical protein